MSKGRSTSVRVSLRKQVAVGKPPCHICGRPIDYSLVYPDKLAFVIDHVVPLAAGGLNSIANVRAAHASCNRRKSDRPYAPIVRRSGALQ